MGKKGAVIVIAEAGVNHNGDIKLAKKLIWEAANAGADYVKFQSFVAEKNISKKASKARYQKESTGEDETQLEMVKKLELSHEQHFEIYKECLKAGVGFLSTPFDTESLELLMKIDLPILKIASGEVTNLPLLREFGYKYSRLDRKVLLSTGMSNLAEVKEAVTILVDSGIKLENLVVLHCTTEYPAPYNEINLRAMATISENLGVTIGYSDHSQGIEVPIAAVAMGATVIEKHFTLDRNMSGPDHNASLEPSELRLMIASIRNIESALGDGIKKASKSELENIKVARKSIVASKKISKGECFSEGNLATKRPGTGISPMEWDKVIGAVADRDYEEDELIIWRK